MKIKWTFLDIVLGRLYINIIYEKNKIDISYKLGGKWRMELVYKYYFKMLVKIRCSLWY